jgi:hypothetical protein
MIFIMRQRPEKRQCPVSVQPYSTRRTLRVVDFFIPLRWLLSSALGIIRPKSQIFSDDSYTVPRIHGHQHSLGIHTRA